MDQRPRLSIVTSRNALEVPSLRLAGRGAADYDSDRDAKRSERNSIRLAEAALLISVGVVAS